MESKKYDLNKLRNWKRSQLRLLSLFVKNKVVTQDMIRKQLDNEKS
jgi:hypothetical protein